MTRCLRGDVLLQPLRPPALQKLVPWRRSGDRSRRVEALVEVNIFDQLASLWGPVVMPSPGASDRPNRARSRGAG